jgi:hypothetical protein
VLAVSLSDVLAVIALVVALTVLMAAVAGVVVARRLRRPLLLAPGVRGVNVPLRWRWSLSPAAVMHRRLVVATSSVLSVGPVESTRWGGVRQQAPWQDLVGELLELAVSVDRRLVAAERQPRPIRRRLFAEIEPQVVKVEQVAERMRTTVSAKGLGGGDRSAEDVVARLDAIDAALGEIEGLDPEKALERGAGPSGQAERTTAPATEAEPAPGPPAAPPPATGAGSNTATSWTEQVPWPGQRRGGGQGR